MIRFLFNQSGFFRIIVQIFKLSNLRNCVFILFKIEVSKVNKLEFKASEIKQSLNKIHLKFDFI